MTPPVKLSDIIAGMDFQSDESQSYLNTTTGEVVSITMEELRAAEEEGHLEDFPAWQHDTIRIAGEMLETDHSLPLPERFEINEYCIMERFCVAVDDDDMRDDLCNALPGRGAFRRCKDRVHAYGLAEAWYRYRDAALREIALAWCEEQSLPSAEPADCPRSLEVPTNLAADSGADARPRLACVMGCKRPSGAWGWSGCRLRRQRACQAHGGR